MSISKHSIIINMALIYMSACRKFLCVIRLKQYWISLERTYYRHHLNAKLRKPGINCSLDQVMLISIRCYIVKNLTVKKARRVFNMFYFVLQSIIT